MKITIKSEIKDSAVKGFIRDFNIAFGENNKQKILEFFADEIEWNLIGGNLMNGKREALAFLETMGEDVANEIVVDTIVTEGNAASANGEIMYDEMTIAFCDVYEFIGQDENLKIKTLTSYGLELKK